MSYNPCVQKCPAERYLQKYVQNALFWAAEGQNMSMALCESADQQHLTSCSRGYERKSPQDLTLLPGVN